MDDLFSAQAARMAPLADRMRPRTLDEFIGQEHIVGEGRLLRRAIEADRLTSSIFFGPPGTGKTTLATIIAATTKAAFAKLNAVTSGVKDVREIIDQAESRLKLYGQPTYLLLDECHRWNKAQSDSILPPIAKRVSRVIGPAPQHPILGVARALVNPCPLARFEHLGTDQVKTAILRALQDPDRGFGGMRVNLDPEALEHIADVANGDVRSALNAIELAVLTTAPGEEGVVRITPAIAAESIQRRVLQMDESLYYDMLSAFCKSLRGSDSTAALAWFAKLIHAGMDPRIIARRIIAHASEDVGLANPTVLNQCVAAAQALELIGMPEARLPLAQAIILLCESPKSNGVVMAVEAAMADAEHTRSEPVPLHLQDAHYKGAERLGCGKDYLYPHDFPGHYVAQNYRPAGLENREYFLPGTEGYELKIREIRARRGQPIGGEQP